MRSSFILSKLEDIVSEGGFNVQAVEVRPTVYYRNAFGSLMSIGLVKNEDQLFPDDRVELIDGTNIAVEYSKVEQCLIRK
jgi:hypothetical protein